MDVHDTTVYESLLSEIAGNKVLGPKVEVVVKRGFTF